MRRWAFFTLDGADDLGYPHQSPEQERIAGRSCMDAVEEKKMPEDFATQQVVESLSLELQDLARLHWRVRLTQTEIVNRRTNMTRQKVRARITFIKELVSEKVLM